MVELKTFPDTLEYTFENVRGIVQIYFKIFVEFSYGDIKQYKFYDVLTSDHISLKSQYDMMNPNINNIDFYYNVNNNDYIRISIPREKFLINFKNYYMKYLKKHTDIIKKYTTKYDPIARKHLKIIEENPRINKIMIKWINCALCYLTTNKGELRKFRDDVDDFFEKLDLHQEDDLQNPKVLLRETNKIFEKFPRYSKEFTVWRGLNVTQTFEKGNIINNPMPFSTSLLPYTARGFLGNVCCMLEITVPKNFPVIFLHKYRFWEKEVILTSCKFKVESKKKIKRKDLPKYLGDANIPWIQQFKRQGTGVTDDVIIVKCSITDFI